LLGCALGKSRCGLWGAECFDLGLGHEIDFVARRDLGKGFSVLAKAARFWGEGGQPDTTRVSVEMGYRY